MTTNLIIDKAELQMMLNNYWSVDNNEMCFEATVLFLQRLGLNDLEIKNMFNDFVHWNREKEDWHNACFKPSEEIIVDYDNELDFYRWNQ